jgi:hypothetical protein
MLKSEPALSQPQAQVMLRSEDTTLCQTARLLRLKGEVAKAGMPTEGQLNKWLEVSADVSDPELTSELTYKLLKSLAEVHPEFLVSFGFSVNFKILSLARLQG